MGVRIRDETLLMGQHRNFPVRRQALSSGPDVRISPHAVNRRSSRMSHLIFAMKHSPSAMRPHVKII